MTKSKKVVEENEETLDSVSLDNAELEAVISSVADLDDAHSEANDNEPKMSDTKWSNFVMKHFEPDECDQEGNPFVHGLRRVARLLLGPIVNSCAKAVNPPVMIDGSRDIQITTVEYSITFLWCRLENGLSEAYNATFTDVADVYVGNTEPEFARFPSAMAATRAEARCLRKALQIRRCSAEEKTKVPLEESGINGLISSSQINFINVLCQRCNIDVIKFLNCGNQKYDSVNQVPYKTAAKMVEHLSMFQREPVKVPPGIRGYDTNWSKS